MIIALTVSCFSLFLSDHRELIKENVHLIGEMQVKICTK